MMKVLQTAVVILIAGTMMACGAKRSSDTAGGGVYGDGTSTDGGIGLGTLQRIYFDFDRDTISREASSILNKNAKIINANPKMRVLVEGHCDERGTNEYNVALGERRAKTTLDYLVSLGVPRSRLEMKSWGEEKPLDSGHNEAAYDVNRRAEFVILAK